MAEAQNMQQRVLRSLEGGVARTCHDIAVILGETDKSITARLGELARAHKVERHGTAPRVEGRRSGPMPALWRIRVEG